MKPVWVLKFGGTSLAGPDKVRRAASIVAAKKKQGCSVVAVVSARARLTDELIADARALHQDPSPRELDMLLTSGERISSALLSIALNAVATPAISLSGSQAGIITDDCHTNARIIEVRPYRVVKALEEDLVVVVGGFQGVSFKKEITTLGRGGSDVTAVALASALDAEACEIYSDVDGVYSADPRMIDHPRRLESLSYQEMQEMAEAGAKVLHPKSIEFAKIKGTLVHAKSTMEPHGAGTLISNLEGRIKPRVVGVASEEKVVLVRVSESAGEEGAIDRLVEFCDSRDVQAKQLSFHTADHGGLTGSLILPERENYHLESVLAELGAGHPRQIGVHREFSALSLIGAGITQRHDRLREALRLLRENQIPVGALHTSSFRISFLVPRTTLRSASRLLHRRFIESG